MNDRMRGFLERAMRELPQISDEEADAFCQRLLRDPPRDLEIFIRALELATEKKGDLEDVLQEMLDSPCGGDDYRHWMHELLDEMRAEPKGSEKEKGC